MSNSKKLINWSELSNLITNSKDTIRSNRVPKVHKERVEELLFYIKCWEEGKKLSDIDVLRGNLEKLDIITMISGKK